MSCLLTVNMVLFINISNFCRWNFVYIMTLSVAHWDTWKGLEMIMLCSVSKPGGGVILLITLMASDICLQYILLLRRKKFLSILISSGHLSTI